MTGAVALAAVSGCATGTPATSDTPRRDLAGRPALSAPTPSATSPASAAPSATTVSTSAGPASDSPRATPATSRPGAGAGAPTSRASSYRLVVALTDGAGDQGLDGPSYADLRRVEVADDGHNARVTVLLGGPLPVRTATRESIGLGVDLYRSATQSVSDYQLFADGEPDGWFAYLDTPKGFVRYPGTFALGADRVVFTVPWSSLGGPQRGYLSAFADWTQGGKPGTLGGNASSQDRAPTIGTSAYAR